MESLTLLMILSGPHCERLGVAEERQSRLKR
jgi:hypothetical protein